MKKYFSGSLPGTGNGRGSICMAESEMNGLLFNLQRFSTHDGPGIRTTVFLKGCNLNCAWCHNPESINGNRQLLFEERKCRLCGACARVCPEEAAVILQKEDNCVRLFDYQKCTACGLCVEACPENALSLAGYELGSAQLIETLLKDRDYYTESGGGVTFSGGEALLQADFFKEAAAALRQEGIHVALDTALAVHWDIAEEALSLADLVLLDIKTMDEKTFDTYVGPYFQRVLINAEHFSRMNIPVIVRIPLMQGVNDSIKNISDTAEFIADWPSLAGVELLPYHNLGQEKITRLNNDDKQSLFTPPTEGQMNVFRRIFRNNGIKVLNE